MQIAQCPSIDPQWDSPAGVPIDAMLFGGRRATVVPLVYEARDWEHGVFLGSTMSSETTAAQAGAVGKLRFDPMAMLPFCGYNMADYFAHWLEIGRRKGAQLPRIFYVNWFRRDEDGRFLWPGFGENSRVLAWIFRRLEDRAEANDTAIGLVPPVGRGGIDTTGLDIEREAVEKLLEVDPKCWIEQLPQMHEHYGKFGHKLPDELREQLHELERRLRAGLVRDVLQNATYSHGRGAPVHTVRRRPAGAAGRRGRGAAAGAQGGVARAVPWPRMGARADRFDRGRDLRDPLRLGHRHRPDRPRACRRADPGRGGARVGDARRQTARGARGDTAVRARVGQQEHARR